MKKLVSLILAAMFLCSIGCAKKVVKNWEAAGGSRSDATIIVGYSYINGVEIPQVDQTQARKQALERCLAWGYQDAEPFGLISKHPVFGTNEIMVTQSFQCLGRGDSATPLEQDPINAKRIKP